MFRVELIANFGLFFLLIPILGIVSCENHSSGHSSLKTLFDDFEQVVIKNDKVSVENFVADHLLNIDDLKYLAKNKFEYEELTNNAADPDFPKYHFEKLKKFNDKVHLMAKGGEIKFNKHGMYGKKILSKKLGIERRVVSCEIQGGELKHEFNFGEMLKINGKWKKIGL